MVYWLSSCEAKNVGFLHWQSLSPCSLFCLTSCTGSLVAANHQTQRQDDQMSASSSRLCYVRSSHLPSAPSTRKRLSLHPPLNPSSHPYNVNHPLSRPLCLLGYIPSHNRVKVSRFLEMRRLFSSSSFQTYSHQRTGSPNNIWSSYPDPREELPYA